MSQIDSIVTISVAHDTKFDFLSVNFVNWYLSEIFRIQYLNFSSALFNT